MGKMKNLIFCGGEVEKEQNRKCKIMSQNEKHLKKTSVNVAVISFCHHPSVYHPFSPLSTIVCSAF